MDSNQIDEHIISRINAGEEKAFSLLYEAYYTYLNTIAIYYLFDKNVSAEVVDDVFMAVWCKRETLTFPVHYYLVRSVQNGCLNYIRMQQTHQSVLDKHQDQQQSFFEDLILSTPVPLQYVEMRETEAEIRAAVDNLPLKCRLVFEEYFYVGKSAEVIAADMSLNISTVRVQLKNATDRLKQNLKHLLLLFLC